MKKVTVVVGTSRGLGKDLAEHLLSHGHIVYGCSRSDSDIKNANYFHSRLDLVDENAIRHWFSEIGKKNNIDNLIYNAATGFYNHFLLTPLAEIEKNIKINFLSAVLCAQEAVRFKCEDAMNIILISSVLTQQKTAGHIAYTFSKMMIENFTSLLATELAPFKVRVNAVAPGAMASGLGLKVPLELFDQSISKQTIKITTENSDVIHVVTFLLDPASRLLTGQIIRLGGSH